ncbi:MAG: AI-2E family transporter [Clostridia bacterium]|nr:AI-2E family transporter [Clostridia bacterium]
MKLFKNSDKRIVSSGLAIALGAAIMLFVALNLRMIGGWVGKILSYLSSVLWGLAIAYLLRPFAKFVERKLPKRVKKPSTRYRMGAAAAVLLLIVVIVVSIAIVVPRVYESVSDLIANSDSYINSLKTTITGIASRIDFIDVTEERIDQFIGNSTSLIKTALNWLQSNYERVLSVLSNVASVIVNGIVTLFIAMYALFDMKNIKRNLKRIELALFGRDKTLDVNRVLKRGDNLMTGFLSSNTIDALIVGVINFIFLTIADAPYALFLSIILGVTNFVPTFGPIVGGVAGALVLLLTDSPLVLPFIIFTLVLQQIDGNVLKPILFGDSTGLSGFWVMVAIVVGGEIGGVMGMILGVPVVAFIGSIIDEKLSLVNGELDLKSEPKVKRHLSLKGLFKRKRDS